MPSDDTLIRPAGHLLPTLGEGVLTDLLRIVYENIFSNAPKTLYFARDFLMAGIAAIYEKMEMVGQQRI